MSCVDDILAFWFGRPGESGFGAPRKGWWGKDPAFDEKVRSRFLADYERAAAGDLAHFEASACGSLALILLLDQCPRNLFRGTPKAYATDAQAIAVARRTTEAGYDRTMLSVERWFVYMPFEHSEDLADQRRSVALFRKLPDDPDNREALRAAVEHHGIIERFGRFPHRNAILGRDTTPEEAAFLVGTNNPFWAPAAAGGDKGSG